MTHHQKELLNEFFVGAFNKILLWEQTVIKSDGCSDLSVNEAHVLEAVRICGSAGQNTMSAVAKKLGISASALSTAVNALVRKEYLKRATSPADRRTVLLSLTEKGKRAEQTHRQFHDKMVECIGTTLSDVELFTLLASLARLREFFDSSVKASLPSKDINK